MMRVLLYVREARVLRDCEGDGNAGVVAGGGVVAVSLYKWVVHVFQVLGLVQRTC